MKWFAFFILSWIAIGLQIGLGGVARYHDAPINFVLLIVVFTALYAPRDSALLGCFILGFLQDLVTQQPLGLNAFAYGLVAMFITASQGFVYRRHPLTHFILTLLSAIMVMAIYLTHSLIRHRAPVSLLTPLITAIVAPFILWPLSRINFVFFTTRRKNV
jgi:rod shape-determining protein MreD